MSSKRRLFGATPGGFQQVATAFVPREGAGAVGVAWTGNIRRSVIAVLSTLALLATGLIDGARAEPLPPEGWVVNITADREYSEPKTALHDAINEASDDDVLEVHGTVVGGVTVDESVTIRGVDGGTIQAAETNQFIVIVDAADVTLEDLVIDGENQADSIDGRFGIDLRGSADGAVIKNNQIQNIVDGSAAGGAKAEIAFGIRNYQPSSAGPVTATIEGNTFENIGDPAKSSRGAGIRIVGVSGDGEYRIIDNTFIAIHPERIDDPLESPPGYGLWIGGRDGDHVTDTRVYARGNDFSQIGSNSIGFNLTRLEGEDAPVDLMVTASDVSTGMGAVGWVSQTTPGDVVLSGFSYWRCGADSPDENHVGYYTSRANAEAVCGEANVTHHQHHQVGGGSSTTVPGETVEESVEAGGTATTDPSGNGPTQAVPLTGSVTSPNAGTVAITIREAEDGETPGDNAGFTLVDHVVDIEAPDATSDAPLGLDFTVHSSKVSNALDAANLLVFRDGEAVPACTGPEGTAEPDPCVASIEVDSSGDVTIAVLSSQASVWTFAEATSACPNGVAPGSGFDDATGTHAAAIDCAAWWGLADGYGDGTYGPGGTLTRAQGASFIARLLSASGAPLPDAPQNAFDDVEGAHALGINQLAAIGVVSGYEDNLFRPGRVLNREQTVALLARAYRHAGGDLPPGPAVFEDLGNSVHTNDINAAAAAGIAQGIGGDQFDPGGEIRRGQMASFITRILDLRFTEAGLTLPS